MDWLAEAREARDLIQRCLSGSRQAVDLFQQQYGVLIYEYPIRVYRLPADEAGDFYVFAFEGCRILRRLQSFEARAPFRAYLLGFVLDHLVLEWMRGRRDLETIPMDKVGDLAGPEELETAAPEPGAKALSLSDMLATIEPAKAVIIKLLYIEDCELDGSDLRHLASIAGRELPDLLNRLDELRTAVREREARLKETEGALDAAQAWIHLYERRLGVISRDLGDLIPTSSAAMRLRAERQRLEHLLERRRNQRARLLSRVQRRKTTAPYKEIASLLNTSIGNVASQIARVRRALIAARERKLRQNGSGEQK